MYTSKCLSNIKLCVTVLTVYICNHTCKYYLMWFLGDMESVIQPRIVQIVPQSGADNGANLTLTALTTEQVCKSAQSNKVIHSLINSYNVIGTLEFIYQAVDS